MVVYGSTRLLRAARYSPSASYTIGLPCEVKADLAYRGIHAYHVRHWPSVSAYAHARRCPLVA
eukprot:2502594-Rhodomonas_salina.2